MPSQRRRRRRRWRAKPRQIALVELSGGGEGTKLPPRNRFSAFLLSPAAPAHPAYPFFLRVALVVAGVVIDTRYTRDSEPSRAFYD